MDILEKYPIKVFSSRKYLIDHLNSANTRTQSIPKLSQIFSPNTRTRSVPKLKTPSRWALVVTTLARLRMGCVTSSFDVNHYHQVGWWSPYPISHPRASKGEALLALLAGK